MQQEKIFGKILQEERKAKKISQEKLAKLTGLDRTFISLIENGKSSPSISTFLKICSALEIAPSELFSMYEKKDPDYMAKMSGKRKRVWRLTGLRGPKISDDFFSCLESDDSQHSGDQLDIGEMGRGDSG